MRKFSSSGIVLAFLVAIVAAAAFWTKSTAVSGRAEILAETIQGISPFDLHLQVDIKNLPVQEIENPV